MGIRYNVVRVYPLFGRQSQKRSKFSNLEKFRPKVVCIPSGTLNPIIPYHFHTVYAHIEGPENCAPIGPRDRRYSKATLNRISIEYSNTERSTQPSIPPGSVNEYQLRLGRRRQVWPILFADETQGVQVKL